MFILVFYWFVFAFFYVEHFICVVVFILTNTEQSPGKLDWIIHVRVCVCVCVCVCMCVCVCSYLTNHDVALLN